MRPPPLRTALTALVTAAQAADGVPPENVATFVNAVAAARCTP